MGREVEANLLSRLSNLRPGGKLNIGGAGNGVVIPGIEGRIVTIELRSFRGSPQYFAKFSDESLDIRLGYNPQDALNNLRQPLNTRIDIARRGTRLAQGERVEGIDMASQRAIWERANGLERGDSFTIGRPGSDIEVPGLLRTRMRVVRVGRREDDGDLDPAAIGAIPRDTYDSFVIIDGKWVYFKHRSCTV